MMTSLGSMLLQMTHKNWLVHLGVFVTCVFVEGGKSAIVLYLKLHLNM